MGFGKMPHMYINTRMHIAQAHVHAHTACFSNVPKIIMAGGANMTGDSAICHD